MYPTGVSSKLFKFILRNLLSSQIIQLQCDSTQLKQMNENHATFYPDQGSVFILEYFSLVGHTRSTLILKKKKKVLPFHTLVTSWPVTCAYGQTVSVIFLRSDRQHIRPCRVAILIRDCLPGADWPAGFQSVHNSLRKEQCGDRLLISGDLQDAGWSLVSRTWYHPSIVQQFSLEGIRQAFASQLVCYNLVSCKEGLS